MVSWRERTKESYTAEKRWQDRTGDLVFYLLYRPISLALTPPLAALNTSPTAVSLLGLLVALGLPWIALQSHGGLWVAAAALTFEILDGIDGNLARVLHRVSRVGAYVDMLSDRVFSVTLYWSVGLLAERSLGGYTVPHGATLSLLVVALVLIIRICDDHVIAVTGSNPMLMQPGVKPTFTQNMSTLFGGLRHLVPVALIPAVLFGRLDLLLLFIAVHTLIVFAVVQLSIVKALR